MGLTYSIIIPVLNEASRINGAVARIRALRGGGDAEVIVVDGDSEGGTLRALTDAGVRRLLSGKGRGRQLNRGAREALGDVLVFLHADTLLPAEALCRIGELMADERIAGGAFDLAIDSPRPVFRLIEAVACLRSRLTRIPYGDQTIFVRRGPFLALGGFRELPIMEDVDFMRRLKGAGGRIEILKARSVTSARRWEEEGVLFTTLRNWSLVTLFLLGVDAARLARWYRPHSGG